MLDLQYLYRRHDAESRSISAENPDGSRGGGGRATMETSLHPRSAYHGRELGQGWKLSPCRRIGSGESVTVMSESGSGIIRHMWFTLDPAFYRDVLLRIYWDEEPFPSVECPIGDFFCVAWGTPAPVQSVPINVNPKGGLNTYLPMPFRTHARIDVVNEGPDDLEHLFYTIDYSLESVPEDVLYLHAQFRRTTRIEPGDVHTILDGVNGAGHYIGTFMAWEQHTDGWWGEGEVKMYLDGDGAFPTVCGTGTEDYFGGAWCFGDNFSAPFLGYRLISGEEGKSGARMTMYRFHVPDPVFFRSSLKITVQALGWQEGARYLQLEDDISSVAYWYQTLPPSAFPALPDRAVRNQ